MIISYMKRHLAAAAGAVMLAGAVSGCSEWTEPQSVDIYVPTLETENPELYASSLQGLRDYRSSEHKVVIGKFDNVAAAPAGRAEHLNCLPDSIDYVVLNSPDNLSDAIISEMTEVRDEKGMKTLYEVSYETIETEYKAYLDEWNAAHSSAGTETAEAGEEGSEEGTEGEEGGEETPVEEPQAFNDFLAERTDYYLSLADKYGYDGIVTEYNGVFTGGYLEEAKAELLASETVFFDKVKAWIGSHPQSVFIFEGIPFNMLYDRTFLTDADFLIIAAENSANAESLTFTVEMSIAEDVPADRIIIGVTMPSLTDETSTAGYFSATDENGNSIYAVNGAADWVNIPVSGFGKAGICVDHVQYDYFDINKIYRHVREAIAVMNPSPLN